MTNEEYEKEISNEEFVEDEHPRNNDGKFVKKDGGSSSNVSNDKKERMEKHNKNIRVGSNMRIEEDDSEDVMLWKELRKKKVDLDDSDSDEWFELDGKINVLKNKIKLAHINNIDIKKITEEKINRSLNIQEEDMIDGKQKNRIINHFKKNAEAVNKSKYKNTLKQIIDEFNSLQPAIGKAKGECEYDPKTDKFGYSEEMLCGSASETIFKEVTELGGISNVYHGSYNNKEGNHRKYGSWSEIGHVYIQLDDGTIVDPAYGQMYPLNVIVNSDLRLRIISPDDPEHDLYTPEFRSYPFSGKSKKLEKSNNYGKDIPRSSYVTPDELGKYKKPPELIQGFSTKEDKIMAKKNTLYFSDEAFKEEEHPRDGDGKFTDKGGSSEKTYESGEKVAEYKKEIKEEITPTKEENEKNSQVEKSVIDGIRERIKGTNYEDKIKFIETQGSFAKGTDLAGSSDLDIFVGFDYDIDIKEIEEVVLELGDDVLKPISDEGEYKIMNGAGKKYPESYVNGVEVQIIGTSDVTLEQIKKGFEEGGMKTATDRSPHHTRFMRESLKGKEQDVRTLKKFFKNAGVYDASIAKQGFSGFSTEVLIHNLGSFEKVLDFFANFEKGSVIGETSRKFDTPLVMVDPIDENRNLASAFSHSEREGSIIPNKNLARLIKSAQSVIETGKLPEITKEKEDSITIELETPDNLDRNEVYSQAYSSAMDLQNVFKTNGYGVMVPTDKITDDFEVKVPRINVEYDGKNNVKINFGLKNFENEYEYKSKMKKDRPKEQIDAFMERNEDVVEIGDTYYARVKREFNTAEKFLHGVVNGKVKNVGLGVVGRLENNEWVNKWKTKNISRGEKEYENITGKIKSTESYVVITEAEFKEEEHPRDNDGKFTKKGSGSSSQKTELQKLDDEIGTTKDFINKWGGWNRTATYDNLIDKGGLSSATWKTNTDVRVGDRLSVGIIDVDAEEDWDNAKDMFLQALEDNPKFKKVFKEYEKEVEQQNKALQKRYGEEKTFYRGGTVDELEAIFGKYEDKYYNPEWRSRYNFKSLSMNYEDTLKMYNGGMMIHFNGDSVRESQSKLVNYKAEPTKYLHANVDSSIDQEEIENIDTDNPAFLLDEEEVRVNNENMNNVKIDKIEIFTGSAGFGLTSKILHEKFGIDYYGDKRNELDGLVNNWYVIGKWDENGGKYFNVVDGKIVDKKTNKEYEKTKEGFKDVEKEMKLEIQNALMKNKKFREKVKEVVIK